MRASLSDLLTIVLIALVALLVQGSALAQEEVILYPPVRLDPGTASDRFANEFSATARGLEVVGLWMKEPPIDANSGETTLARAYSSDGGVTWTIDDFHAPDGTSITSEYDPMTAYDPRTRAMFIGGLRVSNNFYVARRELNGSDFTDGEVTIPGGLAIHDKP